MTRAFHPYLTFTGEPPGSQPNLPPASQPNLPPGSQPNLPLGSQPNLHPGSEYLPDGRPGQEPSIPT